MQRKFFVLVNPVSGKNKIWTQLRELCSFFDSKNFQYEVFETRQELKGQATVKLNMNNTFSDLVVLGGDGTINEAINGLEKELPVSFVPSGSGNDFVKGLDLGKNLREIFDTILYGSLKEIDLGICNNRKFANGVGIGFDGQIVKEMLSKKVPFLTGQAKYYYHVLHILTSYKSRKYKLKIDSDVFDKNLILLTVAKGSTFGGGFKLTPHAKLDDGMLAICEISDLSAIKRYLNLVRLQNGSHDVMKEVSLYHANEIILKVNDLLEGHIDGEYMGKPPFKINVLPKALNVRVRTL